MKDLSSFKYLGNVIQKERRISEYVKDRIQVGNRAYAANHHMLKSKIIKKRISECVKDRIQVGNRAYAANHHMLNSKIIERSAKMQIYKMLIRPVVTYGSETWTLIKSDENMLRIFERKILHKMYGPIPEGDIWRIRNNEEMNRSINGKDVLKFIKAQTIRWLGHV